MPGMDRPGGAAGLGCRAGWCILDFTPWVACRASLNEGRAAEGVCTQIPSLDASTNRTSSGDSGRLPCFQEHKGTQDKGRRLRNGKTPSAQEAELTTSGVQPECWWAGPQDGEPPAKGTQNGACVGAAAMLPSSRVYTHKA